MEQSEHPTVSPVFDCFRPGAQLEHAAALAIDDHVPAAQKEHTVAPAAEYDPAAHNPAADGRPVAAQ